jgi:hypothetical protein
VTDDALFSAIRALINQYDPEDLLDIAPQDEYDPEVRELVNLARGREKITSEVIARAWLRYFGASDWPAEHREELVEIAIKLEAIRRDLQSHS